MKLLDDPNQLLAGEPDWGAIYRVVRDPMYRAVWRVLRPHRSYSGLCDDDIVIAAFEELRARGLEGVTSLVGMAACIAKRRALDVVGRPSREVPRPTFPDAEDTEMLSEELRREELFQRAMECIEELSPRQRVALEQTVLKLRRVEDVARNDLDGVTTQAVYKLRLAAIRNVSDCVNGGDEGMPE